MARLRKPRSVSWQDPRRLPWATLWLIGLLSALAVLLGLAFMISYGAPTEPTPVAEVLQTATNAGVAVALTVLLLTVMAWCFRHLWFDWLAWQPGRIEVDTFSSDAGLGDAELAQYTLRFRERLARLKMRAPASVPGTGPEGDFLEVLGRSGVDSRNWLGSALSLLKAAKPRHAWQISGVLVQRKARPRYGLTIQVLRLPDQGKPPTTHWGHNWGEAVSKGADEATAAILPRTRRCGPPWSSWKRFVMEGELIGAYEYALTLERDRRYDEAMDAYFRASAKDPLNMTLRLQIGHLQEKLELYLDALNTYEAMLRVDEESRKAGAPKRRGAAKHEHNRAMLVARYRRMVLLSGEELVDQWRKTGASDEREWRERDWRRHELRERLRARLSDPLREATATPVPRTRRGGSPRARLGEMPLDELLKDPPKGTGDGWPVTGAERSCRDELGEALSLLALSACKEVLRDSQRQLSDGRLALSPESVRLTAICINMRLDSIQAKLGRAAPRDWPPNVQKLKRDVSKIERWSPFHRWHEHYNAACAYALPLLTLDAAEATLRADLTDLALERLAKAAGLTNSAYIVGRRDWLLSEDPDLEGLRPIPDFRHFEATYFPAERSTPPRPAHVKKLQNARYVAHLLRATAERWEQVWHTRWEALHRRSDIHAALAWWEDEYAAWALVGDVARNYRHWHARWRLIDHMRNWGEIHDFQPLDVPFPRYEDEPLAELDKGEGSEPALDAAQQTADRFDEISKEVASTEVIETAAAKLQRIRRLQHTLRELDADGREPRRLLLAVLCDQHAGLWQRLREWLESPVGADEAPQKAFECQVERTADVWCGAHAWWRKPKIVVRGGRAAMYRRRGHRNGELAVR